MYNNAIHKTVLLQSLITLLNDEGIEVNTAAAVNIEKVLFNTDLQVYNTFSKLKFRIVPILSRNKEEQDIIYKIFDKFDEKVKTEGNNIHPPGTKQPVYAVSNEEIKPEKWLDKLKRITKSPVSWIIGFLVIGLTITIVLKTRISTGRTLPIPPKIIIDKTEIVVNDTVRFTLQPSDNSFKKTNTIHWIFPDTTIQEEYKIAKVFHQPGNFNIKVLFKTQTDKNLGTIPYAVTVLCEPPPSVVIERHSVTSATGQVSARKSSYIPLFTNASKDSASYRYNWYVNGSRVATSKILNYKSKPVGNNEIKLVVDCKGIHCSTDSLVNTISERPPIHVSVTGDGMLAINKAYNWRSLDINLIWLLIIVIIPAVIVYRLLKPYKKREREEPPVELQEPYSIRFNNQEHTIHPQKEIEQLADTLRKRQVSNVYKLNIRKTIHSTVRSGGLPTLAFVPLTKPSDYLVFIESNNDDSHVERLFKYLVKKLESEQVNLTVYEYRKEPLFLSNEKMNHTRIPLERVAALYPDRTLLIFADTKNFILPLKNTLKRWVNEKLNTWNTRIIITPLAKNDWDKKEHLLIEAKFTVIPADLNANAIIEKIINGTIESQSEATFEIPATYTTRLYNFQEFDSLKQYLANENLLKWVCALAVYPTIDWNLTIAIGKKLENEFALKGQAVELVNYFNLLKIGRISWLQDGIVNDTLRIKMLKYLDNETEMLARQTLVEQLKELQEKVSVGSMIKREFEVYKTINTFLLDAYEQKKPSKKDEAFIKEILSESQLDQVHEIYLNSDNDTLLKDPFKKSRSVNFKEYFRATSLKRKLMAFATVLLTLVALVIILIIRLQNDAWRKPVASELQFIIKRGNVTPGDLVAAIHSVDTVVNLNLSQDSIFTATVMIEDTAENSLLTISTANEELLAQDSFKLNSKLYTIQLSESTPIPLNIFYKNAADLPLANAVEESLPANFDVTIGQQNFKDTALRITYSSEKQKKDAELVNAIARKVFTRDLKVIETGYSSVKTANNSDTNFEDLPIAIYITSKETCTLIGVTGLPAILNDNWHGDINNRNIEINLPGRLIKYSTGDEKTFGLYSINEVCLGKNNVYRIITRTDKGYKAFFIRNVNRQTFELAICQPFYKTKEEINQLHENYCDKFNTMKRQRIIIRNRIDSAAQKNVKDTLLLHNRAVGLTQELKNEYQKLYDQCKINTAKANEVDLIISKIKESKPRYEEVSKATGVPWYFIGIIHLMNGALSFKTHLLNGDPLTARTVNVPTGRPKEGYPPFTWEESAIDAIKFNKVEEWSDWSIPGTLFKLEDDNGFGYRRLPQPINSPFLWAGSNNYSKGKMVADGRFDPNAVSKQTGAGVILKAMDEKGLLTNYSPAQKAE